MKLEAQTLRELLTGERPRATKLTEAIAQENRLRLHNLSVQAASDPDGTKRTSDAVMQYLQWVKDLLPDDKYNRFAQLFRAPLPTAGLTGEIYDAIEKCFDGRDPVEVYYFTGGELESDWQLYREKRLGGRDAWRSKGMAALRQRPNGVCIVDLREQTGSRPEPYWYIADLGRVFDMDTVSDSDELKYLILTGKETDAGKQFYVFDSDSYRVVTLTKSNQLVIDSEEPHDLGYCPARMFWTDAISEFDRLVKNLPLSTYLADLDKFLFHEIGRDYLELYAKYPIVTTYESDCRFADDSTYCQDGLLHHSESNALVLQHDLRPKACPACGSNRLVGPGTVIEVPAPSSATEGNDLGRNAVQIIGIDRSSLDFNVEESVRRRREIYEGAVGSSLESMNKEAINEKQVQSLFEARRAVLMRIKKNFEAVQKWAESACCELRYGPAFQGCTINYGTEFFLFTAQEILDAYEVARAKGLDHAVLDYLQEQYFQTLHRESPKRLERSLILLDLDPARHLTAQQAADLFDRGLLTRQEYALKVNMSTLVDRFERENVPLTEFGLLLDYRTKIERIRAALMSYVPIPETTPTTAQTEQDNG